MKLSVLFRMNFTSYAGHLESLKKRVSGAEYKRAYQLCEIINFMDKNQQIDLVNKSDLTDSAKDLILLTIK